MRERIALVRFFFAPAMAGKLRHDVMSSAEKNLKKVITETGH